MRIYTADSLTDAEIRHALEHGYITADLAVETGARLGPGQWYAPADVRTSARSRVADILNARTARRLDEKYDPPTREQLEGDVAGVALAENGNPDHGPYVVFRAVCGAHGYSCAAAFRDPVGFGGGSTPREAMISLARSLRDTADRLMAVASPGEVP